MTWQSAASAEHVEGVWRCCGRRSKHVIVLEFRHPTDASGRVPGSGRARHASGWQHPWRGPRHLGQIQMLGMSARQPGGCDRTCGTFGPWRGIGEALCLVTVPGLRLHLGG